MFNSTILDVAVGLIFAFLTVSLIASAAVEAISSALKWRSGHLLVGIKRLVNDPEFAGLALALYRHAAVNPQGIPPAEPDGAVRPKLTFANAWPRLVEALSFQARRAATGAAVDLSHSPAYVDKLQFAAALMDILKLSGAGVDPGTAAASMQAALDDLLQPRQGNGPPPIQVDPQLHLLLSGIVQRCQGDVALVQRQIADWFDLGMDRLSGAYKRRTQLVSFLVALTLAVVVNVDAIQVGHVLWTQPTIADELKLPDIVATAIASGPGQDAGLAPDARAATAALAVLDQHLPLGWQGAQSRPRSFWGWVFKLLGWLVTAGATLFGAPFWFDTLQAIVRLKGTGPSPRDKLKDRVAS